MAKGIQSTGLIILIAAMVLYLMGSTFWLGLSVVGVVVETIGWVVWVSESRQANGSD